MDDTLHLIPEVAAQEDQWTKISVSHKPVCGSIEEGKKKAYNIQKTCGVCGNFNTLCISWVSGGTSDGSVDTEEFYCLKCGKCTLYDFNDRM